MTALEASSATKHCQEGREKLPVLKGASLELERGEVVALEGPSGPGKTTLLFILGCLLTPTSGRVVIEGEDVDPGRPDRLPARREAERMLEAVESSDRRGARTRDLSGGQK